MHRSMSQPKEAPDPSRGIREGFQEEEVTTQLRRWEGKALQGYEDPRKGRTQRADKLMTLTLVGEMGRPRSCMGWGPGEPQRGVKLGCGRTGEAFLHPRPGSAPTLAPTACLPPITVPSTPGTSCLFVIPLPF